MLEIMVKAFESVTVQIAFMTKRDLNLNIYLCRADVCQTM